MVFLLHHSPSPRHNPFNKTFLPHVTMPRSLVLCKIMPYFLPLQTFFLHTWSKEEKKISARTKN